MEMAMLSFANSDFGTVHSMLIKQEPWFVGKDVCDALGYTNSRKAIIDHVEEEDKGVTKRDTPGGVQDVIIINEPGVYSLIFSSKLPAAKTFKRWVTHEVLPSLRQQGFYTMLTREKTIELLTQKQREDSTFLDCIDKQKIKREALREVRTTKVEETQQLWFRRFTHHEEVNVPKELRHIWAGDMPMYHKYLDQFHADANRERKGQFVTI